MDDLTRVRDHREPGHFWADNEIVDEYLPDIGVYGFAVYMLLTRYADSKTGQCDPSISTIATKLKVSQPTVRAALEKLKDAGLLGIRHRRKEHEGKIINRTSVYTILAIKKSNTPAPTKPGLVLNDIDQVLNQVDQGTKGDLGGVLNQVSSNKTHVNKTHLTRESEETPQSTPAPSLYQHPGVITYTAITGLKPDKIGLEKITSEVTDIPKWEQAIKDWLSSGYKAVNIKGMVDWYNGKGRHQQNGNGHRPQERPPPRPPPIQPVEGTLPRDQIAAMARNKGLKRNDTS